MGRKHRPKHLKRNIALALLLALLCIGAAELAACRYFEPAVYDRIVAPARYAAGVVVDTGRAGLDAAGRFCLAAGDAAGRFFRAAGDAVSRFAADTGARAAALWTELTAPEEPPVETAPPGAADSAAPTAPVPAATVPPVTELLLRQDGREILTGGITDVTYFCQTSPEWADQPYGTDTIGPYGCGPTTMAMAVASLTGTDTDPAAMAAWAAANGCWASRSGSYHSIVLNTARSFGITAGPFASREAGDLLDALGQGNMLVALVGPGHFTEGGHFILIRGVTQDGKVLVADPNSLENSLATWDPQIILDELSSARDNGAPLWILQTPDT